MDLLMRFLEFTAKEMSPPESLRDFPSALLEHRTSPVLSDRLSVAENKGKSRQVSSVRHRDFSAACGNLQTAVLYFLYRQRQLSVRPYPLPALQYVHVSVSDCTLAEARPAETDLIHFYSLFRIYGRLRLLLFPRKHVSELLGADPSFLYLAYAADIFRALPLFHGTGGKRTERFPPGDRYVPRFLRDGFLHQSCLLSLSRQRR